MVWYFLSKPHLRGLVSGELKGLKLAVRQGNQAVEKSTQKTEYWQIYRSREVGQSYITSVFTTLWAFVHAMIRVLQIQPDVVSYDLL